jgi:hypothetical protein
MPQLPRSVFGSNAEVLEEDVYLVAASAAQLQSQFLYAAEQPRSLVRQDKNSLAGLKIN